MMPRPITINFSDICTGSTVRVTGEKTPRFSVVDIINAVEGKRGQYGEALLHNMYKDSILPKRYNTYVFPGGSGMESPVVTLQEALDLLVVLPGKVCRLYHVMGFSMYHKRQRKRDI